MFEFTSVEIFFIIGMVSILLEFTQIPGIGLLFIGLGSLTSSICLYFFPKWQNFQIALLGFSSCIWFIVLFFVLGLFSRSRSKKDDQHYSDMIGEIVEVIDQIVPSSVGKVSWCGTIMNATLDEKVHKSVSSGTRLYVCGVKGNVLICSFKNPDF